VTFNPSKGVNSMANDQQQHDRAFLAVGPHVWGYGPTAQAAIKRAKQAGCRSGTHDFNVYGPAKPEHDLGIDGMGRVTWYTKAATVDDPDPENPDHWRDIGEVAKQVHRVRVR
jgi:hypothetical protein